MYIKQHKKPIIRPLLVRIAVLSAVFLLGCYWTSVKYDLLVQQAYKAGFEAGLNSTSWKDRALSDHKYSTKLCTAWWFQANATERKLR